MKKKIWISAAAAALAVSIGVGVWSYSAAHPPYNMHPDVSQRDALLGDRGGGAPTNFSRMSLVDTDGLTLFADLVVVGTVMDNGSPIVYDVSIDMPVLDEKLRKNSGAGLPLEYDTVTRVKIDQLIAGEAPSSKFFNFVSLGPAEQSPIRKGEKWLFILAREERDGTYCSVDFENGLFYVNKDGTLTAMSGNMICARYDGLPVSSLTDDIKKTKTVKDKLSKKTKYSDALNTPDMSSPTSSEVSSEPASSAPEPPPVSSGVSSAPASSAVSSAAETSSNVSSAPEVSSEAQ